MSQTLWLTQHGGGLREYGLLGSGWSQESRDAAAIPGFSRRALEKGDGFCCYFTDLPGYRACYILAKGKRGFQEEDGKSWPLEQEVNFAIIIWETKEESVYVQPQFPSVKTSSASFHKELRTEGL